MHAHICALRCVVPVQGMADRSPARESLALACDNFLYPFFRAGAVPPELHTSSGHPCGAHQLAAYRAITAKGTMRSYQKITPAFPGL